MQNTRNEAIKETLKWEGGYTNHPKDPGGPTNWGITIADAKKYWKKNATAADVKKMPLDIAVDIYRTKYWKTPYYDCDKLAAGVDLAVFDFGVNSGPSRAKRYLDKAVGGTSEQTINRLMDARVAFLKGLKTFPTFGKGWMRRCTAIRKKSLELAKVTPTSITGPIAATTVAVGTAGAAAATDSWMPFLYWGVPALIGGVGLYLLFRFRKNKSAKKN